MYPNKNEKKQSQSTSIWILKGESTSFSHIFNYL
jgi:hypothetical protein